MNRRKFLGSTLLGATALGSKLSASKASAPARGENSLKLYAGHQHDHTEKTLHILAACGVTHICSGLLDRRAHV